MTRIQAICAVFIMLATVVFVTHVETRPEPPEEQPSPGTLESDIKLTEYQRQAIAEMVLEVESGASVRKALANLTYLWPNATLPYVISASSANNATLIKQALAYWESNTCIRFPLLDSPDENAPRIEFIKGFGCYSSVGYTGGFPQEISIGDFCVTRGTVVHEIGHAFGFWHEQSRTDRDHYVTVHLENIEPGREDNFNKYGPDQVNSHRVPYDLGSVMHYGPKYFSIAYDKETITANDPDEQYKMGQRDKLSAADVLLANLIYNCSAGPKVSTESTFQADTQCVSPYKVNSQASLMWASSVLPDVGDTEEYWVDGNITNNYIWFSDGSEMVVESTLFHLNEPSGRGHCIQLRFKNGYWALEDNSCNHKQKYICSAMPVISIDMEVPEFAHVMCSSGSLYQITDLATLERAQVAIATNGIDGKVWVDGHKDNNTITFTGGSTIAANPALFHQNGNNGSGSCLILEFSIDGWKLNAVKCDSFEHYLCVG